MKDSFHKYYAHDVEWYNVGEDLSQLDVLKTKIMEYGVMATCMCYSGSYISDYIHYQLKFLKKLPDQKALLLLFPLVLSNQISMILQKYPFLFQ